MTRFIRKLLKYLNMGTVTRCKGPVSREREAALAVVQSKSVRRLK